MASQAKHSFKVPGGIASILALLALGLTSGVAMCQDAFAQQSPSSKSAPADTSKPAQASAQAKPKMYSSPQEAADALYAAARSHDEDGLMLILGPSAKDVVVWTDDPEARMDEIDEFAQKYAQMHRFVKEPDNETTLYVGAENWPLPIPLVQKNRMWYFDCDLGRREIMFRRIGENEVDTIATMHALVDAENDFYSQNSEYANRLTSDAGKHDGLYWDGAKSMDDSPVGPFLAQASIERSDHKPLHGYFFKILASQGPGAPGGARNYVVDGKMTNGFAFIAIPAVYRSSGVETFLICQGGEVYEKDLGPATAQAAKTITSFNPDSTWTKID